MAVAAPGVCQPNAPVARGRGDQPLVAALEPADEVVGAAALEASDWADVLHFDDDLTAECLGECRVGELRRVQKRRVDHPRCFLDSLQRYVHDGRHAESSAAPFLEGYCARLLARCPGEARDHIRRLMLEGSAEELAAWNYFDPAIAEQESRVVAYQEQVCEAVS